MADIDQLIRLLERWRDASGVGRLSVGVDATRAIRSLSPAAKRELAAEVAERVAPQLVPQIRAEEGDLSSEQVGAVVDLLRRADREQIDDLVRALRTGDVDASLTLVDQAIDAVAPTAPRAATAVVEERIADADERVDDLIADALAAVEQDQDSSPDLPSRAVVTELDEAAVRAAAEEAAAARAARWADTSTVEYRPQVSMPEVHFDIDFGDVELPDPTVEEVAPLEQRRHDLPGAARSPGGPRPPSGPAGRPTAGSLAAPPTPAVVAAITATPDGYRRRRAALGALRDERLAADDVSAVVLALGRPMDRAWVAGAALDAGLLDGDALDSLALAPTAVRRLRARAR